MLYLVRGLHARTVDKTMQTVDLLPTLANLFGLPAPRTTRAGCL